ncbi:aminopeptidase N-like isoform X2 [Camponotus floridanus]|uniref:aminopeptidase N-like isoform X2 n=1 Tax=Camponotus floridanus TaxID=104421 RepID=UPI000DC6A49C|nr:aminopeptidase N-like isoform X2 [Camponotus floridanus]
MKFNMTFLKLLLSNSIIYLAIVAIASPMDGEKEIKGVETDEESKIVRSVLNNKLSNILGYILPIHYNIELVLLNNYLRSNCIITLNIFYAKQYISFYAPDSVSIIVSTLKTNNGTVYETNHTIFMKNNIYVLDFGDVLLNGKYDLYIEYEILINIVRESFGTPYLNEDEKIEWLIATGIQRRNWYQTKKQQIFPYWDNPELGITFVISILHHPKYKALSNMPIRETKLMNYNMMWTFFHKTPLISIDSVACLVSSFHQSILSKNERILSSIWFRPQSEPHLEFAKTVIISASTFMNEWNILKKAFENPFFSFESKVDHVAIPALQKEIEQTFGFVFYREADITYNEELDPVVYKTIITRLIAHGMIQKYTGNLFRPTYLWSRTLIEGFNIFWQEYIIDKVLPNSRMMDLFVVQVQHELLYLNTYVVINSTIEYNSYPENYFHSSLSHIKGSVIWRMLERTLPLHIFSEGFIKYLNNQLSKPEATTADHLWNAMRSKLNESYPKYDFNIKDAINSWIMQKYPSVLEVTRNYSSYLVTISVQFHNKLEKHCYIPITYATESNPNFTITWTEMWLTPRDSKIEFLFQENNQWIIINLQQAGYYRVNYDIINWGKIAQYLNSEKYSNIHVLNRAQIINDAFHFAIEKKLKFSIFWELASYLAQETDYIAWYPMLKAFEFLSNIFPFLNFYPEFKGVLKFDFMQKHRISNWNLLNQSHINDRTKCLKQELAKWKCIMNDHSCEESSKHHLKWHLANLKKNKLLPGWKRWTYCNGLKTADRDTWDIVFYNYMKGNDKMFECLIYSKNSEILIHYLEIITHTVIISQISKSLYNQFHLQLESIERAYALNANIFLSILERNTKYMLTNLLNNDIIIRHRRVNEIVALIVIINNAYSMEQLDEIQTYIRYIYKVFPVSRNKVKPSRLCISQQSKTLEDM